MNAAARIVREFEEMFGVLTATERYWLINRIVDLAHVQRGEERAATEGRLR